MQNTSLIDDDLSSPWHPSVYLSSPRGGKTIEKATLLTVCHTKYHETATLSYRRPEAPASPYCRPDAPIYLNTLRIQCFLTNKITAPI